MCLAKVLKTFNGRCEESRRKRIVYKLFIDKGEFLVTPWYDHTMYWGKEQSLPKRSRRVKECDYRGNKYRIGFHCFLDLDSAKRKLVETDWTWLMGLIVECEASGASAYGIEYENFSIPPTQYSVGVFDKLKPIRRV